MTLTEQIITIGICIVAVQFTRLLPFLYFLLIAPFHNISVILEKFYPCNVWYACRLLL